MRLFRRIYIRTFDSFLGQTYRNVSGPSYSSKRQCFTLQQDEEIAKKSLSDLIPDLNLAMSRSKVKVLQSILIQKPTIVSILSDKANIESINWKHIMECADEVSSGKHNHILVLDLCYSFQNYNAAISYVKYLRDQGLNLNLAIQGRYLYSYFLRRTPLTPSEEQDVINICDKLRKGYECLDDLTLKYIIIALTLTSKWEDALKLCNNIEMFDRTPTVLKQIVQTVFTNGKPEVGYRMLPKLYSITNTPSVSVYNSHLNYYSKHKNKDLVHEIEKLFYSWGSNQHVPYNCEVEIYSNALQDLGWQAHDTNIKQTGQCEVCGRYMKPLLLKDEEFERLRKVFMEKVIIGNDIYFTSDPKELASFKKFIDNIKPYDVVIDGLNVMYLSRGNTRNEYITVPDYFASKGMKVLFLTRKHRRKDIAHYRKHNQIYTYSFNNSTLDDVYILYAALASGPNTSFVSADLMRQHKFTLGDKELQQTFKTWQLTHQYRVLSDSRSKNILDRLQFPLPCGPYAQKTGNAWHISCFEDSVRIDSYDKPRWVCLQPPQDKSSGECQ